MPETAAPPRPEAATAASEAPNTPEAEDKKDEETLRIVLTSLDQNVDAFAREAAHEKIAKKHEGPLWKRIAKGVWGNLTREYQLVKATQEARQEIQENENLLHHHGKSDEKWREATVKRYGSEYAEALVHDGETFHKLAEPEAASNPNAQRIRDDLQDLMRQVARGEVSDDDSLNMMIDRMNEQWRQDGVAQEYLGEGRMLAHNVSLKARELEAMINSAEGLSDIDKEALLEEKLSKMEIVMGEARVGSRAEIEATISERIAEKLKGVPFLNEGRIGRVVSAVGNETVVAGMVSAAAYLGKRGLGAASKVVLPGLGAGIVAGIRERRALRDERMLAARRLDAGKEINPDNKAQVEMDNVMYEAREADELLTELSDLYAETGELKIIDRADLEKALRLQAEVRARIKISDTTDKRLIAFGEVEGREDKSFDLDLAMAKLEVDIKKLMEDPTSRATLGLGASDTYYNLHGEQRSIAMGMLDGEMKAKDRLFLKLTAKRVFKRAFGTTLLGAGVAGAVNEGADAAAAGYRTAKEFLKNAFSEGVDESLGFNLVGNESDVPSDHVGGGAPTDHVGGGTDAPSEYVGWSPSRPDSVGSSTNVPGESVGGSSGAPGERVGGQPNIPGERVGGSSGPNAPSESVGSQPGGAPSEQVGGSSAAPGEKVGTSPEGVTVNGGESYQISDTAKVTLPEGFKAEVNGDAITLTTPTGEQISGITLDKNGALTAESLNLLRERGFTISDHQELVKGPSQYTTEQVTPTEYAQRHAAEMKKINIARWDHNNTEPFDENELRLDNYKDSSGRVILDLSRMTEGGSRNGGLSDNWKEAANNGMLKIYLSASEGTQAHAFEVTVGPDGKVAIDKDHPAYALFNEEGKFIGGYQQAAVNGGQLPDGSENIAVLATVVGGRAPEGFTDTIEIPTYQTAHHYTVQAPPTPQNPTSTTTMTPPDATYGVPVAGYRRQFGQAGPEDTPPAGEPTPDAPGPDGSSPEGSTAAADASTGPDDDATTASPGTMPPGTGPGAGTAEGGSAAAGASSPESGGSTEGTGPEGTDTTDGPGESGAGEASTADAAGSEAGGESAPGDGSDTDSSTGQEDSGETAESSEDNQESAEATDSAAGADSGAADGSEASEGTAGQDSATSSSGEASDSTGEEAADTSTASDNTGPQDSTADGTSGPEDNADNNAGGPEAATADTNTDSAAGAEQGPQTEEQFFASLDNDPAEFPDGYDFSGMRGSFDERERRLAARFIRMAESEIGGDDKAAVAERAVRLLGSRETTGPSAFAATYEAARSLLQQSAERTRQRAESDRNAENRGAGEGATLLEDLESESGTFPFRYVDDAAGFGPQVEKLVTRAFRGAREQIKSRMQDELRETLRKQKREEDSNKPEAEIEAEVEKEVADLGDQIIPKEAQDPAGYKRYINRIFRQSVRMIHPDQFQNLPQEQHDLLQQAQKVFSAAKTFYTKR